MNPAASGPEYEYEYEHQIGRTDGVWRHALGGRRRAVRQGTGERWPPNREPSVGRVMLRRARSRPQIDGEIHAAGDASGAGQPTALLQEEDGAMVYVQALLNAVVAGPGP